VDQASGLYGLGSAALLPIAITSLGEGDRPDGGEELLMPSLQPTPAAATEGWVSPGVGSAKEAEPGRRFRNC